MMPNRPSLPPQERERRVSELAYQKWEEHGRPRGRDLEFWTAAEAEIDGASPRPPPGNDPVRPIGLHRRTDEGLVRTGGGARRTQAARWRAVMREWALEMIAAWSSLWPPRSVRGAGPPI